MTILIRSTFRATARAATAPGCWPRALGESFHLLARDAKSGTRLQGLYFINGALIGVLLACVLCSIPALQPR